MISFRKANDATYIAQLLGRMFRTPLAQRVSVDEYLNSVYLFLPYFNKENVEKIVKEIKEEDGGLPTNMEGEAIGGTETLTAIPPKKPSIPKPSSTTPLSHRPDTVKEVHTPEGKKDEAAPADYTGTLLDPKFREPETHDPSVPEGPKRPDDNTEQKSPVEETVPESKSEIDDNNDGDSDALDRLALINYITRCVF